MTQFLCAVVASPVAEPIARVLAGLVVLLFFVGGPCLAVVFLVRLGSGRRSGRQAYERRTAFLSENERAFYHSLQEAVAGRYAVFAQVRLADLVQIRTGLPSRLYRAALMRVTSKHADFLLCEPRSLSLVGVIELDDRSHRRRDRQRRDEFVNETLAAAGLPLLRVAAKSTLVGYPVADLRAAVATAFEKLSPPPDAAGRIALADGLGGATRPDVPSRAVSPLPRWLMWLVPAGLVASAGLCVLWASPQTTPPATMPVTPASPPPARPHVADEAVRAAPSPSATANDGTDWTRLMMQARSASEQWQFRAEQLVRQGATPLPVLAPDPAQEAAALAQARSERERFEIYDRQGKRWREYAQALDSTLARGRPLPQPLVSTTPSSSPIHNGLPTDEEITARASANANTYAPPGANRGTQAAAPPAPTVNPALKTEHVRSYTRQDGTQVESYNRRPPSE